MCFLGAASLPIIVTITESPLTTQIEDPDSILFGHLSDNQRQEMSNSIDKRYTSFAITGSIFFIIAGTLFFFLGNLIQKVWNIDFYLEHIAYNTHSNIPENKPSQREFQEKLGKFDPKGSPLPGGDLGFRGRSFDKKPDD